MGRMTFKNSKGQYGVNTEKGRVVETVLRPEYGPDGPFIVEEAFGTAIDRLAAYEDSGLEPEGIMNLFKANVELEEKLKRMKKRYHEMNKERAESYIESLKYLLTCTRQGYDRQTDEIKELTKTNDELKKQVAEIKKKFVEAMVENCKLGAEIDSLVSCHDDQSIELEKFNDDYEDLEDRYDDLEVKYDRLEDDYKKLDDENRAKDEEIRALMSRLSYAEASNKNLREKIRQQQLEDKGYIEELTKENEDFTKKIEKLGDDKIDIEETIKKVAVGQNISLTVTTTKDGYKSVSVYPYSEENISDEVKGKLQELYDIAYNMPSYGSSTPYNVALGVTKIRKILVDILGA